MNYTFFMISSSDPNTPITAITPSVSVSVNGGAFVSSTNSPTHIGNGYYTVEFEDAELGTDGPVSVVITGSGARTWRDIFRTSYGLDSLLLHNTVVGSAGWTLNKLNQFAKLTSVNLLSIIVGGNISVNRHDSWEIPIPDLPDLSGYTSVLFSVKETAEQDDLLAQLFVRSDSGLITVGQVAADSSGNGSVTIGTNAVTIDVDVSETYKAMDGEYTWWVKGFNSGDSSAITIATGQFTIESSGAKVTS